MLINYPVVAHRLCFLSRCKIDIVVSCAAQCDESHASSGEFFSNHTAIDEIVYENTHGAKSSREPGGLFV